MIKRERSLKGLWSVEWANSVLKLEIKELKNVSRDKKAIFTEVMFCIRLLEKRGFWWQSKRLRNHLHRYWGSLQPKADSKSKIEGYSS